ncbi:MAG: hypothetical protein LUO89_06980 [Methanothrix sp.]|nr:hypothetical protein [Methanothrix sp.]
MSDNNDQKDTTPFVEGLLKSKYSDLIILSAVILTFIMLIIISTALT